MLHPGSHLLHLSRNHPGEDGGVGPFAEQVILACNEKQSGRTQVSLVVLVVAPKSFLQNQIAGELPVVDLTITLILLRTESKFSTSSSSNLGGEIRTWVISQCKNSLEPNRVSTTI